MIMNTFSDFYYLTQWLSAIWGTSLFLIYINDLLKAQVNGHIAKFANDVAFCYTVDEWEHFEHDINPGLISLQQRFTKNWSWYKSTKNCLCKFYFKKSSKIFQN